jgi:hypothetical protein
MKPTAQLLGLVAFSTIALASCKKDEETATPIPTPVTAGPAVDPSTAPRISVDRFSTTAGTLMVRDGMNGLPDANVAINFDQAPFITSGFGPAGQVTEYYNFDVQPTALVPIWVLFRNGEATPVAGQLNIVDKIPGDNGYNDFWVVRKVTVPTDYVANSVTSYAEIVALGYSIESTNTIVNCPVVPEGSTATKRLAGETNALMQGWYKDKACFYFSFMEHPLSGGTVPTSPIYVIFNIDPDQPNGGPPSGFVTETGTAQTHNVLATVPGDATYSPLWRVSVIRNADFAAVSNLSSAQGANIMAMNVMNVNCPVVRFP